jgi:hypothetical protein
MSALQVIARRVGLEAIDYKKILVEKYDCDPVDLGEVRMVNGRLDVEGIVILSYRYLTKLPFKFGKVGGSFYCHGNLLTSLEGAPKKVGGSFWGSHNRLTSLEGAPFEVGGSFWCENNNLPEDIEMPAGIKGDFFK